MFPISRSTAVGARRGEMQRDGRVADNAKRAGVQNHSVNRNGQWTK